MFPSNYVMNLDGLKYRQVPIFTIAPGVFNLREGDLVLNIYSAQAAIVKEISSDGRVAIYSSPTIGEITIVDHLRKLVFTTDGIVAN